MARALQSRLPVAKRHAQGFTLVELMIVVVIVGILATLAVVGYRKLIQSSHVSEATGMLQNIRVAQEAYHSETQQYASISNVGAIPAGNESSSPAGLYPRTPSYGIVSAWGGACNGCANGMTWDLLPLHVDGPVLFGYATIAGPANVQPPIASVVVNGAAVQFPAAPPSDWYIIGAEADLDGNTQNFTDVFTTSWSNEVFVSNEGK